jgi:uncharacterized protein YjbJ (UPF0337 family)
MDMSTRHKLDQMLGRVKETAGTLMGNDRLRRRGRTQRGIATAREMATDAAMTLRDAARRLGGAARRPR